MVCAVSVIKRITDLGLEMSIINYMKHGSSEVVKQGHREETSIRAILECGHRCVLDICC